MDSPHLLHLGFLLLALAAPCPNIATSSSGHATETQDSGSTTVTVFLCKDCKSCTCNVGTNSFVNFTKIAGTQDKTFSDVMFELVTNKTHITVCFEQANSCLEGIYGIFWKKAGRPGMSCGIMKSGGNGRGNISTEEKNVCCEAEIGDWKHNPPLKCYAQKSHPKPTTLPVGIPDNPEFLTSKKSSIPILFAFLVFLVFTGCVTICSFLRCGPALRQNRQVADRENLTDI